MILSPAYILIMIVTAGLSFWAQHKVKSAYKRYSQVRARNGMSGKDVAEWMMREAGITDVEVVPVAGQLTDHYDPINKKLALSEGNYMGTSIAAAGIAAHEAGHAVQHNKAYKPLSWRMGAIYLQRFTSPLLFIPMIAMMLAPALRGPALMLMAAGMGVIMLVNLITLPVEFDATRRAKLALAEGGILDPGPETEGMNKVLDSAALTYVAAFVGSLLTFLYYLYMAMGRR